VTRKQLHTTAKGVQCYEIFSELQAKESTKASANPQSVSASQIALCVTEAIQAMGDDHCDRAAMILTDVIGQLHTL